MRKKCLILLLITLFTILTSVSVQAQPDLSVKPGDIVFEYDDSAFVLKIRIMVHNNGDNYAGKFIVYMFKSIGNGIVWTNPTPVRTDTIRNVPSDSSIVISVNDSYQHTSGYFYDFHINVDAGDQIIESNESNNDASAMFPYNVTIKQSNKLEKQYLLKVQTSSDVKTGIYTISFYLPEQQFIKLNIYDVKGNVAARLTDKFMHNGSYRINWDSRRFGAGVYYIKLSTGNNTLTKKAVIIK